MTQRDAASHGAYNGVMLLCMVARGTGSHGVRRAEVTMADRHETAPSVPHLLFFEFKETGTYAR